MEILIICPATFLPSLWGYEEQCKIPMPLCQCNTLLKKKSKSINISIIEQLLTDTVKEVKLVNFSNYFCCRDSFTSSFETASHLTRRVLPAGSQNSKKKSHPLPYVPSQTPTLDEQTQFL